MPYIGVDLQGEAARKAIRAYGPAAREFAPVLDQTERFVVEHSGIKDPGSDWNKFRAYDEAGNLLKEFREEGY